MKILVTGGAGFIGSNLADRLVADGHSVIVVDDLSRGHKEFVPAGAKFEQLDIRDPALKELIIQERPEAVCHWAAQIDVRHSVADPAADASINILGLLNLLEGAREAGTRRVIFASTGGAIYGEADVIPTPETYFARPMSPYGAAKFSSEVYLGYYQQIYGISYAALRFANVYGPRQDPHGEAGVVAIFAERMLNGQQPVIFGDGMNTRDYVYVGDVVNAAALAVTRDDSGPLNVGTGVETTVNDVFRKLRTITGSNVEEVHAEAKAGEQRRSCLDSSRLRALGWSPNVDLDEGLSRTVEFFRSRMKA